MKAKFTTLDIKVLLAELQQKLLGMRVNNVYDVDSKTYLIKLNRTDEKAFLLIESGIRFHTTEFEWPKNIVPSGFAMKLRKHLRGRRLESVQQLGVDRIVDMQFGSGEAAYHVILEVYDRGNIVLTDHEYTIINIQRPRADNDQDVKFAVKEKYPLHLAKQHQGVPSRDSVRQVLEAAKKGDNLRKVLNPHLVYGSHLLDHCLLEIGMKGNARLGTEFEVERDLDKLMGVLNNADEFMSHCTEKLQHGYIINQKEKNPEPSDKEQDFILTYSEFHPFLFKQHSNESYTEFGSFDKAVDEFFSKIETQKQDRKVLQQRNTAMKKLEHIKLDNLSRIKGLKEEQLVDLRRAWLIELNLDMVDEVILMLRNALAHQLDWSDLKTMIEEESSSNDIIDAIKSLRLDVNHITMLLKPPTGVSVDDELNLTPMKIDIDLSLSAYANARRFYGMKKHAAVKEAKTIDSLQKAYKSVEKKTMKTLKEVQMVATINKARKIHWFEKFLWFVSSENYMVVGGRDQQQNEVIVKRYMKPGDIYVHADLHGASSIIIKNPTKNPIPPVTLNEAGSMALCNSAAWDSRVVASSWWVYHDQVSKTAPSGEYLTTGSFMIRGKKNYLLPSSLIYGFGFLFKLDESCIEKHKNERRVRGANEEDGGYNSMENNQEKEEEIVVEANEDDSDDDDDDDTSEHKENGDMDGEDLGTGDDETESKEITTSECAEDGDDDDDDDEEEEEEEDKEDDKKSGDDEDDKLETVEPEHANETEVIEAGEAFPDTDLLTRPPTLAESDVPDSEAKNGEVKKHTRLSAKQKRDAKKKKNGSENIVKKETVSAKRTSKPTTTTKPSSDSNAENSLKALKRGQRSKLKKIKQKYKDQDEEERELRMQLLASNGPQKPSKPTKKDKETEKLLKNAQRRKEAAKKYQAMKMNTDVNPLDIDEEPEEEDNKQQETEVLDSLTGIPQADDILHYCIPVCAPWNALINYRFKVKLLPGTSKKGKAARTLVESFIRDKNTTSLEKDLLRSVKDHDLSKNLPGKVKMVKPQKK